LPAAAKVHIGNVFDGGFEWEPSNVGFDWRISRVAGAIVSLAPVTGAGGNQALQIEFEGMRVPFQNVRQLLALPPGRYRLQGRVRLDDLRSDRGLVWTVACADSNRAIAETEPMSGQRGWTSFGMDLVVPGESCGGQWLVLRIPARIPAEQLIAGTAWFDDLQIEAVSR
jgi:hypothetical protein